MFNMHDLHLLIIFALAIQGLIFVLSLRRRYLVLVSSSSTALLAMLVYNIILEGGGWSLTFADNLWVMLFSAQFCYALFSLFNAKIWLVGRIYAPFVFLLAVAAHFVAKGHEYVELDSSYLMLHIVGAVFALGMFTFASICAFAVIKWEKNLKSHLVFSDSKRLPPLALVEGAQFCSLWMGEGLLLVSIVAGGLYNVYHNNSSFFQFDHKNILTLVGFAVVALLLFVHSKLGTRGKKVSRLVLMAYLLLMLGFLGKKLIEQFLIA